MNATRRLRFSKMHGAGNDFVILDRRGHDDALDPALAARLAHRHFGVGCDQVITIGAPRSASALARYEIWNTDGSAARQCGNGARCVAAWLQRDGTGATRFVLDSPAGAVEAELHDDGQVTVGLGVPDFTPRAIGLALDAEADLYGIDSDGGRIAFGAVSMGNPHAVIEVPDVTQVDAATLATRLQRDPHFRDGCNVGFAQVLAPDRIRLRVVERGVGETLACGSGACAAVAVLARRGQVGDCVTVQLAGGDLRIGWAGPGHAVRMTGPATFVFEGEWIA